MVYEHCIPFTHTKNFTGQWPPTMTSPTYGNQALCVVFVWAKKVEMIWLAPVIPWCVRSRPRLPARHCVNSQAPIENWGRAEWIVPGPSQWPRERFQGTRLLPYMHNGGHIVETPYPWTNIGGHVGVTMVVWPWCNHHMTYCSFWLPQKTTCFRIDN